MSKTLYDKLWDEHVVQAEEDGTTTLYIDRHLIHEVTSPQAFEGLRLAGRKPWRITSVVATADHNTPTTGWEKGMDGIIKNYDIIQDYNQGGMSRFFGYNAPQEVSYYNIA